MWWHLHHFTMLGMLFFLPMGLNFSTLRVNKATWLVAIHMFIWSTNSFIATFGKIIGICCDIAYTIGVSKMWKLEDSIVCSNTTSLINGLAKASNWHKSKMTWTLENGILSVTIDSKKLTNPTFGLIEMDSPITLWKSPLDNLEVFWRCETDLDGDSIEFASLKTKPKHIVLLTIGISIVVEIFCSLDVNWPTSISTNKTHWLVHFPCPKNINLTLLYHRELAHAKWGTHND